ncbi:MAG: hypothetical protein IJT95_03460 [Abditibacteriota bacterium]|nr:hypothetical protein [Abditibacteriota bacterium]
MKICFVIIILLMVCSPLWSRSIAVLQQGASRELLSRLKIDDTVEEAALAALMRTGGSGMTIVLPCADRLPREAGAELKGYIDRGGSLLAVSGPCFQKLEYTLNGAFVTKDEARDKAEYDRSPALAFAGLAEDYTLIKSKPEDRIAYRAEEGSLILDIGEQEGWFSLDAAVAPGTLRGDALAVEAGIKGEGSLWLRLRAGKDAWMAEMPLSEEEGATVLTPDMFERTDGDGSLDFGRVDRINITRHAIPMKDTVITLGRLYNCSFRDKSVKDILKDAFELPEEEGLFPACKYYRTYCSDIVYKGKKYTGGFLFPAQFRPGAAGAGQINPWRYIPAAEGFNGDHFCGWPASIFLTKDSRRWSAFGYIGFPADLVKAQPALTAEIAGDMLRRIENGVFLANGGTELFSYDEGEPVRLGAYVLSREAAFEGSVRFDVLQKGKSLYSHTVPVRGLHAGAVFPGGAEGEYEVRVSLCGEDGAAIDSVGHTFNIIADKRPGPDSYVKTKDGGFFLRGKPFYPVGINFYPSHSPSWRAVEFFHYCWLDPRFYDPDWTERDLKRVSELGFNTISISYKKPDNAAPLRDFLARCQRYGIYVHLYVDDFEPLPKRGDVFVPDMWETTGGPKLRALRPYNFDKIFAYDLAWEVCVGEYKYRKAYNPMWDKWVADNFGSAENAEKVWGFAAKRDDKGFIDCPDDEQVRSGDASLMYVTAYRHFLDEAISRGYMHMKNNIHSVDPGRLISARSGCGGTGNDFITHWMPYDLLSGAKHLDFTSPEAYNLRNYDMLKGGFNNAYGRFVSGNKPVFWPEFGTSNIVDTLSRDSDFVPGTTRLDTSVQGEYFRLFYEMLTETGADGAAGWWWPGGMRLIERSDHGLLSEDFYPRPSALITGEYARSFAERVQKRKGDYPISIDRDLYASGYAGVFANGAEEYMKAFEEGKIPYIVTDATGTDSRTMPLTAVGNVPLAEGLPPKYIKGEFSSVNGRDRGPWEAKRSKGFVTIDCQMGNTGEVKWLRGAAGPEKGCVYLKAESGDKTWYFPIDRDTEFLSDARVRARIPAGEAGPAVTLRLCVFGVAEFGQKAEVQITD